MADPVVATADLDAAPWASCGPAALAALLERPLSELRHAFPAQRPGRTWTNLQQMEAALRTLGAPFSRTRYASEDTTTAHRLWPTRGLALVQFDGPWRSHVTALKHTHWITVKPVALPGVIEPARFIFDVNAAADPQARDGWLPAVFWERRIAPMLANGHRRATGRWWVREGLEVSCG